MSKISRNILAISIAILPINILMIWYRLTQTENFSTTDMIVYPLVFGGGISILILILNKYLIKDTFKETFNSGKGNWYWDILVGIGLTTIYTDNRFFAVDCETLFETDGLTEYLDKVNFSFEKLELKLDYANEKSEQTENYWKHTIELNGTEYIAFNGQFTDYDWGIAYLNFIKMLNSELENQNSENRFYPIKCDNDGEMVLLTFKQFDFVKIHFPNDNGHPKKISEWKNINGM